MKELIQISEEKNILKTNLCALALSAAGETRHRNGKNGILGRTDNGNSGCGIGSTIICYAFLLSQGSFSFVSVFLINQL